MSDLICVVFCGFVTFVEIIPGVVPKSVDSIDLDCTGLELQTFHFS